MANILKPRRSAVPPVFFSSSVPWMGGSTHAHHIAHVIVIASCVLRHIAVAPVIVLSSLPVLDDTIGRGSFMFWSDWVLVLWVAFTGLGVVVLMTLALLGSPTLG